MTLAGIDKDNLRKITDLVKQLRQEGKTILKKESNWIRPENQCFYFNKHNQTISGLTDWISNQLDGLETWSLPYDD